MFACASQEEETVDDSPEEITFSEFDEPAVDEEITIDEMPDDEILADVDEMDDTDDIDEMGDLEADIPELPGEEEVVEVDEIDEAIAATPPKPVARQETITRKPYSRAGIGYPDHPSYGVKSSDGTYIVKRGDSLWAISKRYGVSVRELAAANGMSIKVPIRIGQKLVIPDGSPKTSSSVPPPPQPLGDTYTVQSGDSYYKIGKKLGVNYLKLMKYNNDTEKSILQPGQVIKVPQ